MINEKPGTVAIASVWISEPVKISRKRLNQKRIYLKPRTLKMEKIPGTSRKPIKPKSKETNPFYKTTHWQKMRGIVIAEEPYCRLTRQIAKLNVDHIDGDSKHNQRYNLQTLTASVHSWKTNVFEKRIRLSEVQTLADFADFAGKLPTRPFIRVEEYCCNVQFITAFYASLLVAIYNPDYLPQWRSSASLEVGQMPGQFRVDNWALTDAYRGFTIAQLKEWCINDCAIDGIPFTTVMHYALIKLCYQGYINDR